MCIRDRPKGGPDGGDGGRGGNVYLRANRNLWTLLHLKYSRHVLAGNGSPGGANRSFGKDGEDKTIEVPCGTAVFDANTGEFLCEVTPVSYTHLKIFHLILLMML